MPQFFYSLPFVSPVDYNTEDVRGQVIAALRHQGAYFIHLYFLAPSKRF